MSEPDPIQREQSPLPGDLDAFGLEFAFFVQDEPDPDEG